MDVVLVGRNPDKLRAVAELIRKECGGLERRVTTVVADFAEDPVVPRGGRCGAAADETKDVGGDDQPVEQRKTKEQLQDGEDDEDSMLDDVGDICFCHIGHHRHRRCTRWYPRLRAVVECRSRASSGGVGLLINCAGVCYPHPEYFAGMSGRANDGGGAQTRAEFTADFCDNADAAVRCNVTAAVHACRLVLPGMLARGRGLIVNVGSAAASIPPAAPLMTLYAATKKFLEKLSADLDAECAYLTRDRVDDDDSSYGVRVQCARPAYVATAMLRSANPDVRAVSGDDDDGGSDGGDQCWWAARKKRVEDGVERWMVPSARRWVRSALRQGGRLYARGATGDSANFTGYWPHTLLVWCGRLANALTPRRWFIDHVLIPAMLVYRAKGRKKSWEERNTMNDERKMVVY